MVTYLPCGFHLPSVPDTLIYLYPTQPRAAPPCTYLSVSPILPVGPSYPFLCRSPPPADSNEKYCRYPASRQPQDSLSQISGGQLPVFCRTRGERTMVLMVCGGRDSEARSGAAARHHICKYSTVQIHIPRIHYYIRYRASSSFPRCRLSLQVPVQIRAR